MTTPPYLNTPAAHKVAKRIEKYGLTDPDWFVELRPVCMPNSDDVDYALLYYKTPDSTEKAFTFLHFIASKKGGKSAAVVEQLQVELGGWGYGGLKPNSELLRHLPILVNTRRYKLQLLAE